MLEFGRKFKFFPHTKDGPTGTEHGVHGGPGRRKVFNQGPNGDGRQGLLDNVVIGPKVDFPIQNINGKHE